VARCPDPSCAATAPPRGPPHSRAFYATALLAVSTFAAAGLYRLALAHGGAAPSLVWERPGFLPLWVAARTSLLGFQVAAAHAAVLSLRAPSEPWLASVAAVGL
jgi:hypothetical protein